MNKRQIIQITGVILILMGILGFMNNPVLGFFQVNPLQNLIYLLSGGAALYLIRAQGEKGAVQAGKALAIVYAALTLLGLLTGGDILGLMVVNNADNLLHLVLTAVFAYVGYGHHLKSRA